MKKIPGAGQNRTGSATLVSTIPVVFKNMAGSVCSSSLAGPAMMSGLMLAYYCKVSKYYCHTQVRGMRDTGGGVPLRYTCRQMFLSAVSTGTLGISVADPELGFFERSGPRNGDSSWKKVPTGILLFPSTIF